MQPVSASTASGRFLRRGWVRFSVPVTLSSADWRTTHEFSTTTSASPGRATGVRPSCSNADPKRSESAVFIWQPMVQMW